MKSRWTIWLERTGIYRFLLVVIVTIFFSIEQYVSERDVITLFNLGILVLSALSFRRIWMQLIVSGILSILREFILIDFNFNFHMFLFQWLSSFIAASFIMTLIEKYLSEKTNLIDLIFSLAKSLDSRDRYTAFHSQNVAEYSKVIAKEMMLKPNVCKNIYISGLLHDIGKIGVPEAILNKPSKLTDDEFKKIKEHPIIGYDLVKHIKSFERNGILNGILNHHERYDGKGYPHGLKGNEIPLEARIMAVADTFDAMTSRRVYRHEKEFQVVLDEIIANKGTQFDPKVVDAFLRLVDKNGFFANTSIDEHAQQVKKINSSPLYISYK